MKEYYYSNCFIEALKAKIKCPSKIKITVISPFINEVFCPHFLWSDGNYDYDFGFEGKISLFKAWTLHKGHIRKRKLGLNQKYKQKIISCKSKEKKNARRL